MTKTPSPRNDDNDCPADEIATGDVACDDFNSPAAMDQRLQLRLLDILSEFPCDRLPMELGTFFQSCMLGPTCTDAGLDCRRSSHGSVLKWARAMQREGLLVLREPSRAKRRREVPKVAAVGPAGCARLRGGGRGGAGGRGLRAEDLSAVGDPLSPRTVGAAWIGKGRTELRDGGDFAEESECGRDEQSEFSLATSAAMSAATTTNSIATSAYSFRALPTARRQQSQRSVEDRDLQSVLKHGSVATRYRDGKKEMHASGVGIVTKGNTIISTWRIDGAVKMNEHWGKYDVKDKSSSERAKVANGSILCLPSYIVKVLPFLFPNYNQSTSSPLQADQVFAACQRYFTLKNPAHFGCGRLREIAFIVALKGSNASSCFSLHCKNARLYCDMLDCLRDGAGEDDDDSGMSDEEVMKLFQDRGSPRFWTRISPPLVKYPALKHKIKALVKQGQNGSSPPIDVVRTLFMSDAEVSTNGDDLMDLVMTLAVQCHRVGDKWRDGPPPFVTVSNSFARYTKSKKGAWKRGDVVKKHGMIKKVIKIVGLREELIEKVVRKIRKQAARACFISNLDVNAWTSIHGDGVSPFADEGSKVVTLSLVESSKALVTVLKLLAEVVPPEYRRYVAEKSSCVAPQPSPEIFHSTDGGVESSDLYLDTIAESAQFELEDIYSKYVPEKVKCIPHFLKKYRGKETKLVKLVRKKYTVDPYVPPTLSEPRETDTTMREEAMKKDLKSDCGDKSQPVSTWDNEDFSAFT